MSDSEDLESPSDILETGNEVAEREGDHMSISEVEQDLSKEDVIDMPSAGDADGGDNNGEDDTSQSDNGDEDRTARENMLYKDSTSQHRLKKLVKSEIGTVELDDAALQVMTASYSEIHGNPGNPFSFEADRLLPTPNYEEDEEPVQVHESSSGTKSHTLQNLAEKGLLTQEGELVCFIAENLESKIRLSSPASEDSESLYYGHSKPKFIGSFASNFLAEGSHTADAVFLLQLEKEARHIAASVDGVIEHLGSSLYGISSVTVDSMNLYRDAVSKTCDAMDSNIKAMYQLMAKCEELTKAMVPVYKLAEQVKEIKRLLDIFEGLSTSSKPL